MTATNNLYPSVTYTIDFDANKIPNSNTNLANLAELTAFVPQLNSVNYTNNKKQDQTFTLYGEEAIYFLKLLGKLPGLGQRAVDILGNVNAKSVAVDVNVLTPVKLLSSDLLSCVAGQRDRLFGDNGVANVPVNSVIINSNVVDSHRKILVCGSDSLNATALLARYNSDGTLDETFGNNGVVLQNINGVNDEYFDVTVAKNGKIYVCGRSASGGSLNAVVARYNSNGSLDTTFGASGYRFFVTVGTDSYNKIIELPDGRVVAAGESGLVLTKPIVSRFLSNGNFDTTFGVGGTFTFSLGAAFEFCYGLASQNGRIILSGYYDNGGINDIYLAGITSAGALDATFGVGGLVLPAIGVTDNRAYRVEVDSNGFIYQAARTTIVADIYGTIIGYSPTGVLTYQSFSFVTPSQFTDVAIQPDGNIVVAGADSLNGAFILDRFSPDLIYDATFGASGASQAGFIGSGAQGRSVAIDTLDGGIFVSGIYNATKGYVSKICGVTE